MKRVIQDRLDQEEGTDRRESGEIQAHQDHKEQEEVGVHGVSEVPPERLEPLEQRGNLAN